LQTIPPFDAADKRRFVVWDWSPDGARLTGSISGEPMDAGIYSFAEVRYDLAGKMDSFPAWLPDSRRIIYGFENRLLITDTKTKKTQEINLNLTGEIRSVDISHDGKLIYYTLYSSESDIWLLDFSQNQ
jgi:WD40 repeat protein